MDYLETKEQLLLLHSTNVAFYLYMKAQGKSLNGHPVMNQLLEIKYAMEKMKKLDIQLEDALNALFALTEMNLDEVKEISSKGNFVECIMVGKLEDDEDEEDEAEDGDDDYDGEDDEVYEDENGFSYSKEEENDEDNDEEDDEDEELEEEEEDIQFELDQDDEMFNKSLISSKDSKKNKKSSKLNSNIGDIGEFEERYKKDNRGEKMNMETFLSNIEKNNKKGSNFVDNDDSEDDFGGNFDDGGYDDDDYGFNDMPTNKNIRKRQKAPSSLDDDVEEDNLLDAFTKKKKEFKALKLDHYVPAPRIGGVQEVVEGGKKRAASYEIIKNRGLTPHRKKANRNGRVKKKEMYAKAVIARKGQIREIIKGVGTSYGGELTGVKANISRSRKITN
jgi:U3 small nucleolar RNA-associated protein 3